MRRVLFLIVLLLSPTRDAAAQQCRADFNGSGAVEVNELIQAVNEALGGCSGGAATPTSKPATPTRTPTVAPLTCPYRFNQAVRPDRFCGYEGLVEPKNCDSFRAGGGWTTADTDVIAIFVDQLDQALAIEARRTSPTSARVTGISFGPDFAELFEATGMLSLPSGSRFVATFNAGGTCGTFTHDLSFFGLVGDNATSASGHPIAELRASLTASRREATRSTAGSDDRTPRFREVEKALHERLSHRGPG